MSSIDLSSIDLAPCWEELRGGGSWRLLGWGGIQRVPSPPHPNAQLLLISSPSVTSVPLAPASLVTTQGGERDTRSSGYPLTTSKYSG